MDIEDALQRLSRPDPTVEQLLEIATVFFGSPRVRGGRHTFVPPWIYDGVFSIEETANGLAKPYQVRMLRMQLRRLQLTEDFR